MTHGSSEGSNVCISFGDVICQNTFYVLMRWFDSVLTDMMSQIDDLRFKEVTLRWFQLEPMFSESIENDSHTLEVLLLSRRVHNYVIQVDEAVG